MYCKQFYRSLTRAGNWMHVDYVFPATDTATGQPAALADGTPITSPMHLIFEAYDGACDGQVQPP